MQIARRLRETVDHPDPACSTGRAEEADRVMGLELGADDYLDQAVQPARAAGAHPRAAAPRAARRPPWPTRSPSARLPLRRLGAQHRALRTPAVSARVACVELTNGEFSLLAAFCRRPQRVLSRDQLLDLSRLHNAEVYDRSIDVQILRLRRKIEVDPGAAAVHQDRARRGLRLRRQRRAGRVEARRAGARLERMPTTSAGISEVMPCARHGNRRGNRRGAKCAHHERRFIASASAATQLARARWRWLHGACCRAALRCPATCSARAPTRSPTWRPRRWRSWRCRRRPDD